MTPEPRKENIGEHSRPTSCLFSICLMRVPACMGKKCCHVVRSFSISPLYPVSVSQAGGPKRKEAEEERTARVKHLLQTPVITDEREGGGGVGVDERERERRGLVCRHLWSGEGRERERSKFGHGRREKEGNSSKNERELNARFSHPPV